MKYLDKTFSVSMPGAAPMACEACVFGRGEHTCPRLADVVVIESDRILSDHLAQFGRLVERRRRAAHRI